MKRFLDIALLTACRDEFHRRMQMYQQWKKTTGNNQQNLRAPTSVFDAGKLYIYFLTEAVCLTEKKNRSTE